MSSDVMPTLGPIEAAPRKPRIFQLALGGLNAQSRKPFAPTLCNSKQLRLPAHQHSALLQCLGDVYCEPPRQMRIAGSRRGERVVRRAPRRKLARNSFRLCSDRHQRFNRLPYLSIRQPIVAMPALLLNREQPALHQLRQMAAGGLRRNICNHGELSCGQSFAVHECHQDCCPARIAEESGSICKISVHDHSVALRQTEYFYLGRSILS